MNQPFSHHIQELRRRLVVTFSVMGAGAVMAYSVRVPILNWLQAPLHGSLYYSQVMGAFEFLMQACLLAGLLLATPVLVYNLVAFVRPALPMPISRRQIAIVVVASCSLTVGGAAFAYYVSLPMVLHFLSSIDVSHLHPLIAANSYLSFVMSYLAVFALTFQLPLIMLTIDRITPIPPAGLRKFRKWVLLGAFSAAIILPIAPDVVSQVSLAVPIVALYEVSIWLIVLVDHRRSKVRRWAGKIAAQTTIAQSPLPVPPPIVAPERKTVVAQTVRPTRPQALNLRGPVLDLRRLP